MKKFFVFIFFMLVFLQHASAQNINIVIDIDDTLVDVISKCRNIPEVTLKNRIIEIDNIIYAFYDGSDEFIKYLLKRKNIQITFFSSAMKQRNEKLINHFISQLYTKDEYNQIKDRIKILSDEDTKNGENDRNLQPIKGSFFGKRKKDLRIISGDINWTILIDDDPSYVVRDQERNFLLVQGLSCFFDIQHIDTSQVQNRNHFFYALGIILTALNQSYQNKTTLVEELHNIQFDDSQKHIYGNYSNYEKPNQKVFYELGLNALKEINPNLELFLPNNLYPWNQ